MFACALCCVVWSVWVWVVVSGCCALVPCGMRCLAVCVCLFAVCLFVGVCAGLVVFYKVCVLVCVHVSVKLLVCLFGRCVCLNV